MPEKILIYSGPSERGWHRLEYLLRCPQLYAYRYLMGSDNPGEGIIVGEKGPLVRGTIGHVGLAQHYARVRARARREDPDQYYKPEEAMPIVAERYGDVGAQLLPVASAAVMAYIRKHAGERMKVLHVEEQFRARIGWPPGLATLRASRMVTDEGTGESRPREYPISARFDLVYEDPAGHIWIMDHKLVMKVEAKVFARYTLSGQFLLAQWFGHALWGDRFGGAQVNLLTCGGRSKSERAAIGPAPHLLQRVPQIICDAEERIEDLAAEGRDPWLYPAAANEQTCVTAYGLCPAYSICQWGVDRPGLEDA